MGIKQNLRLIGLVAWVAMAAGGQIRTGPTTSNNSSGPSLANTQWKGTYASGTSSNTPATLRVYFQNGSLMGTLTYDGYEETVSVTSTGTRGLRIKGVSYRDLRGGRTFYLDTFTAQISADGHQLNATGGDSNSAVANQWLRLQKVDSAPAAAPQPASQSFVRSLIGSQWDGAIAESQKGGTPTQMRIVEQNGAPAAILTYEQFEEVMTLTFTAPSGIQMRGTSFRDLGNRGRRFTLDSAQGEVSPDGRRMQGQIHGRPFDLRRVN